MGERAGLFNHERCCGLAPATQWPMMDGMSELDFIRPDWPAPPGVRALTTTRAGGVSPPPYDSLNLGAHTGDAAACVAENRRRLALAADFPEAPAWLKQVHGTAVVAAHRATGVPEADGSVTDRRGVVCAILTADCLPVLLCDQDGTRVAALHAGWRGLVDGMLESGVAALGGAEGLMAWLGPAIGPDAFQVGAEVRQAFLARDEGAAPCFREDQEGRWRADLYALAARRLATVGVHAVYGGDHCTHTEAARFYSYRRDGETGRMATLIWLA